MNESLERTNSTYFNTAQHNTAQHNTAQHSTTQLNTKLTSLNFVLLE
jgi:hypothetical protein